MPQIRKSIDIEAPREKVFTAATDPAQEILAEHRQEVGQDFPDWTGTVAIFVKKPGDPTHVSTLFA